MSYKVIEGFWQAMGSNDFGHASRWLDPAFEYFMPQTGEYLHGPAAFAALNAAYPAKGQWRFFVRSIICDGAQAVSDVEITDGDMRARAVTFHTVTGSLIRKQIEYWPDEYPPPEWRRDLVELKPDFKF